MSRNLLRSIESESQPLPPALRWSHPHKEQLERFMRSELSLGEVLPIIRHLLAGCSECLKVTRPFWELMEQKPERRVKRPLGGDS